MAFQSIKVYRARSTSPTYHRRYRPDRSRAWTAKRIYGPRALAGVIQIFAKQDRSPGGVAGAEGGSYRRFPRMGPERRQNQRLRLLNRREPAQTPTTRTQQQLSQHSCDYDVGWSPDEQLRSEACFTFSKATLEIPTRSSIHVPLITFSPSVGQLVLTSTGSLPTGGITNSLSVMITSDK